MASQTLQFDNAHFLQSLFANDLALLKSIEERIPVKITTRDSWVKLQGSQDAIEKAETIFQNLEAARRKGVEIEPQTFQYVLDSAAAEGPEPSLDELTGLRLLGSANRKPISPKTAGQLDYLQTLLSREVVFGIGPAGTGKTFLAVAAGLHALKNGQVNRLVLTRPAVEAGEALGFLPGDLKEKIFPYLRPLYDAIHDMAEPKDIERWIEKDAIEIAPLAYMRGRTLNEAFVILDEAQNTTCEQMLMFLTRLGMRSVCAITGDPTQVDLKKGTRSGLHEAMEALNSVDGIAFCTLRGTDVVRHPVVRRIIEAYDRYRSTPRTSDAPAGGGTQ